MSGVVAIGGGHGLARGLQALRRLDVLPTAVVTVADDGGSSGRLRRDLGIIAPGDLRMALLTLARNDELAGVLAHRFARGELEGHALGNLFLVALGERSDGDVVAALEAAGRMLDCAGTVLPSTVETVTLRARIGGRQVDGQVGVATAPGTLERLWLEPGEPRACPEAVDAIGAADTIVLGPGSLFTSLIVNLLVPGIRDAVRSSGARLVYVANLRTQPGETESLDLAGHLAALGEYLGERRIDVAVVHEGPRLPGAGEPLGSDVGDADVGEVVLADLSVPEAGEQGHDPAALAEALAPFVAVPARS